MELTLVDDPKAAKEFAEAPRTAKDRVVLKVGWERLELNRWGTVLVSALVAGSPMLRRAVKVLRLRRIKRPDAPVLGKRTSEESIAESTMESTATIAAPLGQDASASAGTAPKQNRAMRRATRRVRRYASGPIHVTANAEDTRRFLAYALAIPDAIAASYGDREVVLTPDGARAVLALFTTSHLRLALVHLLLGADAYRPHGEGAAESADPADPWGPFPGDAPSLG